MSHETLIALVLFVAVSSVTPGPNNIMLLTSGLTVGLRRTLPLWSGIQVGFLVMFGVIAAGMGALFTAFPQSYVILKWGGAAWILWLAYKIAMADPTPVNSEDAEAPLGFRGAAAFQWINPKSWVFAISTLGTYTDPTHYGLTAGMIMLVIVLVGVPIGSLWAVAGVMLRQVLSTRERVRVFNILMGVALALTVLPMVFKTS